MEFYNMEQLSKMTEEERDGVARTAESDLNNGIKEPAVSILRTLSDMGTTFATLALLEYLTGNYNNLIGAMDIPGAKAVLKGAGQRMDPADRAYFSMLISYEEFNLLTGQRQLYTRDLLYDPEGSRLSQEFSKAVMDLYEAGDVQGINLAFCRMQRGILLMGGGDYNLRWGEIAQICSWLIREAPGEIEFDPNKLLSDTLKSAARQAALHPYVTDGAAVLLNQIIGQSGWFDRTNISSEELKTSWIIMLNGELCQNFFAQYRLAEGLPLSGVYAELLQEIRRHLSYFKDFEGYDPEVFPKKKLFGNPPPASQWYTYLNEVAKYQ